MNNFALMCLILVIGAVVNTAAYPPFDDNFLTDDEDVEMIDLSHFGSSIFREPNNETGLLVASYDPNTDDRNPEEMGDYLEGDILIPRSQVQGRNGLIAMSSHWPSAIVPFEISGYFDARAMNMIEAAINEYHRRTCIRFRPRTYERDYVSFTSDQTGCWSSVGRLGGRQAINLQSPGCTVKVGTIIHEMMHALGFYHEQNRADRDDYINIHWNNIRPGTQVNFDKQSSITTTTYGVSYDYGSVMHYSPSAFSRNGMPTITAKRYGATDMGQRDDFSTNDIDKINKMYKCSEGQVEEEKPSLNAHNNINALIDKTDTTEVPSPTPSLGSSSSSSTTSALPSSGQGQGPSRPNRPLLNLVGHMIGQAGQALLNRNEEE